MPRLARKNINTPFLHIMVQGVNKEYVFNERNDKIEYLKLIKEYDKSEFLEFLSYCIMDNHAHFTVYAPDKDELSKLMFNINLRYARLYNKNNNRCGVLFRNRYQIQPIYSEKHLLKCINYIHQNPVKAKMVEKCEDYKFSSYNDYKNNTGLAKSKILRELFGENCNFLEMLKEDEGKIFMDVEKPTGEEMNMHILAATREFMQLSQVSIQDIFYDRQILKKLLIYLKKECGISYEYLKNYFEISKGIMECLMSNG